MFKLIDSLLGILVIIVLIKIFMPQEISDLVSEILIKGFTLINDSLSQVAS
jgi:hypothetical protein